jgi:hypothetical protein
MNHLEAESHLFGLVAGTDQHLDPGDLADGGILGLGQEGRSPARGRSGGR